MPISKSVHVRQSYCRNKKVSSFLRQSISLDPFTSNDSLLQAKEIASMYTVSTHDLIVRTVFVGL